MVGSPSINASAHQMRAPMQVPQTVEPLQRDSQAGQQPDEQQAALVVMADMRKSIEVFGIVEDRQRALIQRLGFDQTPRG